MGTQVATEKARAELAREKAQLELDALRVEIDNLKKEDPTLDASATSKTPTP